MAAVAAARAESARLSTPQALVALSGAKGGRAQFQSLQNRKSGFEWAANRATEPILVLGSNAASKWVIDKLTASGGRDLQIDFSPNGGITARQQCRLLSDVPVIEYRCEFRNTGKQKADGVTAFGPLRIPLKASLGPLQVHAVRRNSYAVERIPVHANFELHGGRWNSPEHCGLLVLEAMESNEFLLVGIEWERGWRYRLSQKEDALWLEVDVSDLTHDLARFFRHRRFSSV